MTDRRTAATAMRNEPALPEVLVIDDNPEFTAFLGAALGDEFTVVTASDALDGYALACQRRFDVIVLDVVMPVVDGWAVLRKMRSNPTLSQVPVVVVTGLDPDDTIPEARQLGVVTVLPKTSSPVEVTQAVLAALLDR
jgi:CheY-like chemotaxis protein